MNMHQMTWASVHDWYRDVNVISCGGGEKRFEVIVAEQVLDTRTGTWKEKERVFADFQELKAWAGY